MTVLVAGLAATGFWVTPSDQVTLQGGVPVRTGDWIIGDESGVVVVPQENAVEVANRALDVMERENRIREEIKKGGTLSSVMKLEKWEKVG